MKANEIIHEKHTIPLDMVMDAFAVLCSGEITVKVAAVNRNDNTIQVVTETDPALTKHKKVLANLNDILSDYKRYRHGSDTDSNLQ